MKMFNYLEGTYKISGIYDINDLAVEDFAEVAIDNENIQRYVRSTLDRIGAEGVYINRPSHHRHGGSRIEYTYTINGDVHFVAFDIHPYSGSFPVKLWK